MTAFTTTQKWVLPAVLVPGFVVALFEWSLVSILVTLVLTSLCAGFVLVALANVQADACRSRSGQASLRSSPEWTAVGPYALLVGLATVAVFATAKASVGAACVMALLVVGSTPRVLDVVRRLCVLPAPTVPEPPAYLIPDSASSPAPQDLTALSNAELCAAWRASYPALQRAVTPAERARLVAGRQSYLDEMERRDAAALTAWLESGGRAAGGPERFLT